MDKTTSNIVNEMLIELNDELENIDQELDDIDGPVDELFEERDIIEAKEGVLLDLRRRVEEANRDN